MNCLKISKGRFEGASGYLPILPNDELTRKLAMLIIGKCGCESIERIAAKYGYTQQRYFQLRAQFLEKGAKALISSKRGLKPSSELDQNVICRIIRMRFLNPRIGTSAIVQVLQKQGYHISRRMVERVIAKFGLEKRSLQDLFAAPAAISSRNGETPAP